MGNTEINSWHQSVQKAKKKLGITGFVMVKGKLLKEAQKIHCAKKIK
jgi:hypothetical protein